MRVALLRKGRGHQRNTGAVAGDTAALLSGAENVNSWHITLVGYNDLLMTKMKEHSGAPDHKERGEVLTFCYTDKS